MEEYRNPDVVVVGAGAVGTACAFHLAAAGMRVVVLEQDRVAAGSSTCATGAMYSISADFDDVDYLRWGVQGHYSTKEIVPVVEDLSGITTGFQCRPALRLAIDDDEEAQVRADLTWQSEVMNTRWLTPDEVRSIEPRISREVRGAALEPEAIQVPADLLSQAFMRSAERFGATLVSTVATGLEWSGGRVTGVRHRQGTISCDTVVLAMGASAAVASDWFDYQVPVRPLRGERLMLRWPSPPLQVLLSTPRRGHLISRLDGYLSIGSTGGRDFDDRDNWIVDQGAAIAEPHPAPSPEARAELLTQATEVLPTIEFATVGQHITGIRPLSRDARPIIGPVPGCEGVLLATGHTHRGIHLAAVTGELVRDLVVHGRWLRTSCDASLLDPARFLS
ncbi:FAD-dependent oxidoreductase [Nonomuraea sp. NPDC048916]|uniref:NAD(P)/FAD-dependent oxidoreductase n=1 Tax=Nonomuraea sp. NPDC048916 TaxID=3154232 RepID=UPI00340A0B81